MGSADWSYLTTEALREAISGALGYRLLDHRPGELEVLPHLLQREASTIRNYRFV